MHQRNLHIDMGYVRVVKSNSGEQLGILSHSFEPDRDLYTIKLKDGFKIGEELEVTIPYTVFISQTEHLGLYLGQYEDPETNTTRYLAATKLEPYHARKVMPLFDEPALKAKWKVIVGRENDGKYRSLSNMEIERVVDDRDNEGWVWDYYEETVPMSPYLVCVIVSDFVNHSIVLPNNKRVSTWAPKSYIDKDGGLYAAEKAAKMLEYFEKKFKMSYPLNKLDAVALPQFPTGATENFGVATYRHKNLIYVEGENSESERRKITQVLAHEIAHQWYGNVVTCAWWSEIWLNEGFARYLQFLGMHETIPEFDVHDAFVNDVVQTSMKFDQTPASHPLRNSAKSPLESAAVFNKISYEKGAAVLRMMEGFLTPPVFETGITDLYLHKKKYDSVYQEDLFQALQEAVEYHDDATWLLPSGVTVNEIMATWTLQPGFPLIKVKALDKHTVSISQEKFVFQKDQNDTTTSGNSKWWVPVSIMSGSSDETPIHVSSFWLPTNISTVKYSSPSLDTENQWVMVNPNATSYYRVLYDSVLTEMIKKQLVQDHRVISSSSRSQLLDDYFNLGFGGYIPLHSALELTGYLGKEVESNVWKTVLWHLKGLHFGFRGDEDADQVFKNYFLPRMEQVLKLIGPREQLHERGINVTLRAQLYELACDLDSQICWDYAHDLLDEWERDPDVNPFPLDLRSTLYCPAVASVSQKSSSSSGWKFLVKKYKESNAASEKSVLASALTCSRNLTDLENLLEMAVVSDERKDFAEHKMLILEKVAAYALAKSMVYRFVKHAFLKGAVPPGAVRHTIIDLCRSTNETQLLDEFQKFIEEYERTSSTSGSKDVTATATLFKDTLKELKGTSHHHACKRCSAWWESLGKPVLSWLIQQQLT